MVRNSTEVDQSVLNRSSTHGSACAEDDSMKLLRLFQTLWPYVLRILAKRSKGRRPTVNGT